MTKQKMSGDHFAGFESRLSALIGDERRYSWVKRAGLNSGVYQTIWGRNSIPGPETLIRIAEFTGCSLDWLLTGRGDMKEASNAASRDAIPNDQPHDPGVSDGLPKAAPRREALIGVIIGVETFLQEDGLAMTAEKKAELIVAIYELYLGGSELTPELFQTFVRLAA